MNLKPTAKVVPHNGQKLRPVIQGHSCVMNSSIGPPISASQEPVATTSTIVTSLPVLPLSRAVKAKTSGKIICVQLGLFKNHIIIVQGPFPL